MKYRAAIVNLILVVFGLLIGLAVSEAVLSIWFAPDHNSSFENLEDLRRAMLTPDKNKSSSGSVPLAHIITPHPDDNIIYDLRPNLDVRFQRVRVKTNSCGMRGPERTITKPPGVYRIALLGDSFAFGWGVPQNKIFAQVMEDSLNRLFKGKPKVEVLNFGVPGYSTFQEVAKFKETGLDFNPDAVLVYFVDNDFGMPFYVRDVHRRGRLMSALRFADLARKALDPEIEQQRIDFFKYNPNRSLKELADITTKNGIKLYLTINPRKNWLSNKKKLWVLKRNNRIRFFSLRKELLYVLNVRGLTATDITLKDDPHPNAVRHEILGELLAAHMAAAIEG
ncbi:MAG: SGNH/GDSL hydrolase family protein [Candidatus Dadabacteria bacterium]|nr:MAG: SGNH/GDSL hydrolase family protein [Candidatus Dadabacteria bacterium]